MKKMKWEVCALLLCLCLLLAGFGGAAESEPRQIRVLTVTGACIVERDGGTMPAVTDMDLLSGDAFETPEGGSAQIRLDEDKFLYLDSATRIVITAEGTAEASRTVIWLEKGSLYTDVRRKLSEESSFEIVSANSVMSIRGTKTLTQVIEDAVTGHVQTSNAVLEGKVKIKAVKVKADGTVVTVEKDLGAGEGRSFHSFKEELVSQEEMQSIADSGASVPGINVEIVSEAEDDTVFDVMTFQATFLENIKNILIADAEEMAGEEGLSQEEIDGIDALLDELKEAMETAGHPNNITNENLNEDQNEIPDVNLIELELVDVRHVHTYGDASYEWTDLTACTAKRACACGQTETVDGTIVKTTVESTCTEEGSITYTASFPGAAWAESQMKKETLSLKNHMPEAIPAVPSTCTETGLTEGSRCAICGGTLKVQEVTEPTGHTPEAIPAVPATCTETGLTEGSRCAVCRATLKAQEITEPTGHTSEAIPAVPATCTETGLTEGSRCAVCRATLKAQEITEPTGHTPEAIPAVPATCTETGLTEGSRCAVCGATLKAQEITEPTGHTPEAIPAVPATCTETGLTEGSRCAVCRATLKAQEITEPTEHTPEAIPVVPATCTETGLTEGSRCAVCGATLKAQEITEPTGHTPEAIPAVPATCTETGMTEGSRCAVCGATLKAQEITEPTGHTPEAIPAVKATCTETGLTEGSRCAVCGATLKAQEITEPTGHTPEAIPAVPATCTETGMTEGSRCAVCGAILTAQEETGLAAHTPKVIPAVQATCMKKGLTEGSECAVCGEILTASKETDLAAHTPGEAGKENEAAATSCGEGGGGSYDLVIRCTICETILSSEHVDTEPLPHEWKKPVWKWNENHASAEAVFTCNRDETHTVTLRDNNPKAETTPATTEASGKTVYTATVTLDGVPYPDTEEVELPQLPTLLPTELPSDWQGSELHMEYYLDGYSETLIVTLDDLIHSYVNDAKLYYNNTPLEEDTIISYEASVNMEASPVEYAGTPFTVTVTFTPVQSDIYAGITKEYSATVTVVNESSEPEEDN